MSSKQFLSNIDLNNAAKVVNSQDPTSAQDLATKAYTDISKLALSYTRSGLNSVASASGIVVGQVHLITDENRLAIGLSATTYQDFAKTIEPRRVVVITDATSITINADTTDIATQTNTQVVGTLTVNAPTGTPYDGQMLQLRIKSTNVQTFAWNAIFTGTLTLSLLATSSGSLKWDTLLFQYNSTLAKWVFSASNLGA